MTRPNTNTFKNKRYNVYIFRFSEIIIIWKKGNEKKVVILNDVPCFAWTLHQWLTSNYKKYLPIQFVRGFINTDPHYGVALIKMSENDKDEYANL